MRHKNVTVFNMERRLPVMNKIIIENRTNKPMEEILPYVIDVIKKGRISKTAKGKQYCFGTRWKDGVIIYSDLNKQSDRFIATQDKET